MLETAIELIKHAPWYWLLVISALITFTENIFPPSPSDLLIVFIGALIPEQIIGFFPLLICTTLGSTLGFYLMFVLGMKFENSIVESNKFSFISRDTLMKTEAWFKKWGYWIIFANRFLSGTRAIISFFAGMSKLDPKRTIFLSTLGGLIWNGILISLGVLLGKNWRVAEVYMETYGNILFPIFGAIALIFIIRWLYLNKFKKKNESDNTSN